MAGKGFHRHDDLLKLIKNVFQLPTIKYLGDLRVKYEHLNFVSFLTGTDCGGKCIYLYFFFSVNINHILQVNGLQQLHRLDLADCLYQLFTVCLWPVSMF